MHTGTLYLYYDIDVPVGSHNIEPHPDLTIDQVCIPVYVSNGHTIAKIYFMQNCRSLKLDLKLYKNQQYPGVPGVPIQLFAFCF